jgi:ABC-type uncharacterized transport system involved in gliding motility auxiliary subunit
VKSKGITQSGTVTVEYGKKELSFLIQDELSVTNALLKILRERNMIFYMVNGHQELSCSDKTNEGLSFLCENLKSQNYDLRDLNLAKVKEVPMDASAVLILGPMTGFLNQEAKLIEDYLARGGSVFMALAPAFKEDLYRNLIDLAAPYGLSLGRDVVIDTLSSVQGADATIPIIMKYEETHPITKGFNLRTVFPLSSSVKILPGNDSAALLAFSSNFPGSWAETNLKRLIESKVKFEEKEDHKGPIGLMGVGERVGKDAPSDSRFVLLGSSSFLVNAYQSQSANSTLFLNTISWMAGDEGIISFNRPGIEETPVILSSQHLQMIFFISILLVPVVFFGCAIFIYRRRRLL